MRKLPDGMVVGDLKYPKKMYRDPYGQSSDPFNGYFELWYTERFGWVIPTLGIGGRGPGRRTYAIIVDNGKVCCVGHGPHVLDQGPGVRGPEPEIQAHEVRGPVAQGTR